MTSLCIAHPVIAYVSWGVGGPRKPSVPLLLIHTKEAQAPEGKLQNCSRLVWVLLVGSGVRSPGFTPFLGSQQGPTHLPSHRPYGQRWSPFLGFPWGCLTTVKYSLFLFT